MPEERTRCTYVVAWSLQPPARVRGSSPRRPLARQNGHKTQPAGGSLAPQRGGESRSPFDLRRRWGTSRGGEQPLTKEGVVLR
jgi:hypothetical protein